MSPKVYKTFNCHLFFNQKEHLKGAYSVFFPAVYIIRAALTRSVFSVDARSRREFGGSFLRVYVGGRRAPYCFLSFWLCSLFFLYVVFYDYLLVFIPSLSMKWAPSCAGSLKKTWRTSQDHEIYKLYNQKIDYIWTWYYSIIRSLICYYIYSMYSNFKQPPQSLYDKFVSCVSKDWILRLLTSPDRRQASHSLAIGPLLRSAV